MAKKIARPSFKGYWFLDGVTGKLVIHLGNDKEISYGKLDLTVRNCLADDWFVLEEKTEENKGE